MNVIFVLGAARSGSTMLAQALSSHPDCFAAGEICNVWRHWLAGGVCSCGARVGSCDLWGSVLTSALADHGLHSPSDAEALRLTAARTRYEVLRRVPGLAVRTREWRAYADLLATVYRGLQSTTGCTTIVDTSKKPVDAAASQSAASTYLLHLVRDPRAVAAAEKRRHPADLPALELPFVKGVVRSAVDWSWLNIFAAGLVRRAGAARSTTLAYRAVVADLRRELDGIVAAVGLDAFDWPIADGCAYFPAGHIVNGNPTRFNTGWVAVRDTSASRPSLSARERMLISVITSPATRVMNRRR